MCGCEANRAKCCDPIPGDDVLGYVTRGRGIMLHRMNCPNALAYQANEPERLLPFDWPATGQLYAVNLQVITVNRQGLLMDISTIFGASFSGVRSVEGSSPGIAVARMRVRSGPGLTSMTRTFDVFTVSAA